MSRLMKKTFSHNNVSFSISNLRNRKFKVMNNDDVVAIISLKITKDGYQDFANLEFKNKLNEYINISIMEVYIDFINTLNFSIGGICQKIKKGSYKYCLPENIINKYFICSKDDFKDFNFKKSKTFICRQDQIDIIRRNDINIYFPVTQSYPYFSANQNLYGHIFCAKNIHFFKTINLVAYSPNSFENMIIDVYHNLCLNTSLQINIIKKYDDDTPFILPDFNLYNKNNTIRINLFTDFNQRIERSFNVNIDKIKEAYKNNIYASFINNEG